MESNHTTNEQCTGCGYRENDGLNPECHEPNGCGQRRFASPEAN
jgi:hypothetical protein